MGKTAVLISGEHRFLDQCLPTMKFAQDADVYFSFWNISKIQNTVLGIDCEEYVDVSHLVQYTPRERILVEHVGRFQTKRYNDKMIYRWKQGLNLIRKSGVRYDRIIITRPDLFFGELNESELDLISDPASLYIAWHHPTAFLQDCLFAGTSETVYRVIDSLNILDWQTSNEHDWHTWWTHYIREKLELKTECAFPTSRSIFFRPSKTIHAQNFSEVVSAEHDWRDSKIVQFGEQWGYEGPIKSWGNEIVQNAINRFKSGAFNPEA